MRILPRSMRIFSSWCLRCLRFASTLPATYASLPFSFYSPTLTLKSLDLIVLLEFTLFFSIIPTATLTLLTKLFVCFFKVLFIFREREREGEREGMKHQCVVASCTPLRGTWPATQACALIRNRTSDPLVCKPLLNPLSYTSQGKLLVFLKKKKYLLCSWKVFYPEKASHLYQKLIIV